MRASIRFGFLPVVHVVAACADEPPTQTLSLDITGPDGTPTHVEIVGPAWLSSDANDSPLATWPVREEWEKTADTGLELRLNPRQPGHQRVQGNLLWQGDMRSLLSLAVELTAIRWTGDGAHPVQLEGTVQGASDDGPLNSLTLAGRFTISTGDCRRTDGPKMGCFAGSYGHPPSNQSWTVDAWDTSPECPSALVARYAGGARLDFTPARVSGGGTESLECVVANPSGAPSLCGRSEEHVTYDGCTWSVLAEASYGFDAATEGFSPIDDPFFINPVYRVFAGTVGKACPPKSCGMSPRSLTRVTP